MKIMAKLFIIIVLLFIAGGCNSSPQVPGGIGTDIGSMAPDFQLMNIEGQNVALSDLSGSPVILNFWASWCGPCREEMPFLQQIYEEWQDKGVLLLGINLREDPSTITDYMQGNGLSFPVLLDTDGSVTQNYDVLGIPTTFFIDIDGIIQMRKLGPFTDVSEIEDYISEIQP